MHNPFKRMLEKKDFREDFLERVMQLQKQQQGEQAEPGGPGLYEAFKEAAGEAMEMIVATEEFRQLVRVHRLFDDEAATMLVEAFINWFGELLSPLPEQS